MTSLQDCTATDPPTPWMLLSFGYVHIYPYTLRFTITVQVAVHMSGRVLLPLYSRIEEILRGKLATIGEGQGDAHASHPTAYL